MAMAQNVPMNVAMRSAGKPMLPVPAQSMAAPVPQTGLMGAEQALQGGLQGGVSALLQGVGAARQDLAGASRAVDANIGAGVQALSPFATAGQSSVQLQQALSGALGPEAQAQAFSDYRSSPGQDFFVEQGERALLRNQAALGGLGGGRVRAELMRQGIGTAQQNYQQDFNNLGFLTQVGAGAAGQQGNLYGQGAGLQANLGTQGANMANQAGQFGANMYMNTGQNLAQGRTQAGQAIAGNVANTTSALADLINQQGQGVSSIVGQATGDVSNVLQNAGLNQSQSAQQRAGVLANIATGAGSQVAGLPGLPSVQPKQGVLGQIGDLAGGVGGLITGIRG